LVELVLGTTIFLCKVRRYAQNFSLDGLVSHLGNKMEGLYKTSSRDRKVSRSFGAAKVTLQKMKLSGAV